MHIAAALLTAVFLYKIRNTNKSCEISASTKFKNIVIAFVRRNGVLNHCFYPGADHIFYMNGTHVEYEYFVAYLLMEVLRCQI